MTDRTDFSISRIDERAAGTSFLTVDNIIVWKFCHAHTTHVSFFRVYVSAIWTGFPVMFEW